MNWDGIKRRKTDMPNGFVPKDAFEGYVVGKLEAMTQRLDTLPCKESSTRINDIEKKVASIEGKASAFGAVCGFIGGIVGKYIWGK